MVRKMFFFCDEDKHDNVLAPHTKEMLVTKKNLFLSLLCQLHMQNTFFFNFTYELFIFLLLQVYLLLYGPDFFILATILYRNTCLSKNVLPNIVKIVLVVVNTDTFISIFHPLTFNIMNARYQIYRIKYSEIKHAI